MRKYNKSKIMKLAHQLKRLEGYDMKTALTLAWDRASRNDFYMIVVKRQIKRTLTVVTPQMAQSLTDYYANNTYNGD